MLTLTNYKLIEDLHDSAGIKTSRFLHLQDNKTVVVKYPSDENPTSSVITNIEHEFYLLQQLKINDITQAYDLIEKEHLPILIQEDFGNLTLKEFIKRRPIRLDDFFKIALQLTNTLIQLQSKQIIHKDIQPNNILVEKENLQVKLTNFTIASQLKGESQELSSNILEGTLAYMSPEQTGRVNRPLDYRTDFYSLGITFFEMLTGELPFSAQDPLEIMYCQIAIEPPHLREINPEVPEVLARLIAKLMAKEPAARYSNAFSLNEDMQYCADQWATNGTIKDIVLGRNDAVDKLQFTYKLYGRVSQINTLLAEYNKIIQGNTQLMLISGYSGVGKTALVNEIKTPITKQGGYFFGGKFNQLQRNKPYSAIASAFQNLTKQLLAEPEHKLLKIKSSLLDKLGNTGKVITNIIPNLELIIGPQPSVPELSPNETENRFNFVFQNFLSALAKTRNTLVLFLDDLQWADYASLKLIQNILLNGEKNYLLVIGTYRDNEVDEHHPLTASLEKLQQSRVNYATVNLQPLQLNNVQELFVDMFKCSDIDAEPLAKLILNKTYGNPFFINEFIKKLYNEKLIQFIPVKGTWQWDINLIAEQNTTDNVADLLIDRINDLSLPSQDIIKLAACIGSEFDLQSLFAISQQHLQEFSNHTNEVIQIGLIEPLEESRKILDLLSSNLPIDFSITTKKYSFRFAHDRVQQAAYSLIPNEKRQRSHLNISRILIKEDTQIEREDWLFMVLGHANQALSLMTDEKEKNLWTTYNLWAGKISKSSAAYQSALNFFNSGIELLSSNPWQDQYEITFELHLNKMDCLYITGSYQDADQLYELILEKTKTSQEKCDATLIKIKAYGLIDNHIIALKTASHLFHLIGFKFPKHANQFDVVKQIIKIKYLLRNRDVANLGNELPRVVNPETKVILKLLDCVIPSAYFLNLNLYGFIICKIVMVSLKEGYDTETSTAYFAFVIFLFCVLKQKKLAADFLESARTLEIKAYTTESLLKNEFVYEFGIKHWYKNARFDLDAQLFYKNMEIGNIEYATYSHTIQFTKFHLGMPLDYMIKEFKKTMAFLRKINNPSWYRHCLLMLKIMYSLAGRNIPDSEFMELWKKIDKDSHAMRAGSYGEFCEYLYLIGDYSRALKYGEDFYANKDMNLGFIGSAHALLFYGLSLIKCYKNASFLTKNKYRIKLSRFRREFKYYTESCPENFQFMWALLSAEIMNVEGKRLEDVAEKYDLAIMSAQKNGYANYVAISNQCAGEYYMSLGHIHWTKTHIEDAYIAYMRWGALLMCRELQNKYSNIINPTFVAENSSIETPDTISAGTFDIEAVTRSSQIISSEINLENLLNRLLQVMLEDTGAQRGALLFEEEGELITVASCDDKQNIHVNLSGGLNTELPKSILLYVQRTNETVLLNDPTKMTDFSQDPYIQIKKPRSLLAMPITKQDVPVGYIYLENRLTTNVFTKKRLNVLNILTGQAAISLENAKLYTTSSRFVPHELLDLLNRKNLSQVRLGDQVQQTMSVLFCDIRGFTTLSEKLTPAETFKFINSFLGYMSPLIKRHKGFIDKYIGDAIMALFINVDDAVKAALTMLSELEKFNNELVQKNQQPINIGIGIDTGEFMMGIIGDQYRMEGTVMGDVVNTASRIEDLTKRYDYYLLISDKTKSKLTLDVLFDKIENVSIRGKSVPVTIWGTNKAQHPDSSS